MWMCSSFAGTESSLFPNLSQKQQCYWEQEEKEAALSKSTDDHSGVVQKEGQLFFMVVEETQDTEKQEVSDNRLCI